MSALNEELSSCKASNDESSSKAAQLTAELEQETRSHQSIVDGLRSELSALTASMASSDSQQALLDEIDRQRVQVSSCEDQVSSLSSQLQECELRLSREVESSKQMIAELEASKIEAISVTEQLLLEKHELSSQLSTAQAEIETSTASISELQVKTKKLFVFLFVCSFICLFLFLYLLICLFRSSYCQSFYCVIFVFVFMFFIAE